MTIQATPYKLGDGWAALTEQIPVGDLPIHEIKNRLVGMTLDIRARNGNSWGGKITGVAKIVDAVTGADGIRHGKLVCIYRGDGKPQAFRRSTYQGEDHGDACQQCGARVIYDQSDLCDDCLRGGLR